MQKLRGRVRLVAVLWLLCQAGSLAAFVPDNCCVSHVEEAVAKHATADEACHEPAPPPPPRPGDACPMDHGDGAACPMHQSNATDVCAMVNACGGPGTQLAGLFAFIGTIERPLSTAVAMDAAAVTLFSAAPTLHRASTPDAPPPKA